MGVSFGGEDVVRTPAALAMTALLLLAGCPSSDFDPPEVVLVNPSAGDTLGPVVTLRAVASDRDRVVRVDFYAGGALAGTDSAGERDTFGIEWIPAGYAPGDSVVLHCVARDPSDNVGTSPRVTVFAGDSAGTHHSGLITGAETWRAADNPHIIDSDLLVEAVLRLEPGVRVYLRPGVGIRVGAQAAAGFWAVGRGDSLVVLTALGPGPWRGIEFRKRARADSCRFRYARVELGGAGEKPLVASESVALAVENSQFRSGAAGGIALYGCGFSTFSNNTISGCGGMPLRVDAGWTRTVGAGASYSGNYRNGVEVAGGTVTGQDTWEYPNGPYYVTATVGIDGADNPLLVVAPSCSLLFADSAGMRVGGSRQGGLRGDGAFGSIVFAAMADRWRGIEFWERADSVRSSLRFCRIERAGAQSGPAVSCYSLPITLANCRIADCAGPGVVARGSGFSSFTGNTITGCAWPLEIDADHVGTLGAANDLSGNQHDIIRVAAGPVTRSAQWRRHGATYAVDGLLEVGAGAAPELLLAAGTRLEFAAGGGISVGRSSPGTLRAVGTPDSIVLTGSAGTPGSWRGVEFHQRADNSSRLERCRVLYGGGAGTGIVMADSCYPAVFDNEIGWSSNYCLYLANWERSGDSVAQLNWLHDWDPDFDSLYWD